jgi:hypothetical protein
VSDRQITVTLDEEVVRRFLAGRAGNPVVDALNAALDNSQTPSGEEGEGEGAKERAEIRRLAGALHHESDLQAVRSLKAMADARLEQYNEAVKREADERTHREFAVQKVKELEAERAAHPHDQETPQVSSGCPHCGAEDRAHCRQKHCELRDLPAPQVSSGDGEEAVEKLAQRLYEDGTSQPLGPWPPGPGHSGTDYAEAFRDRAREYIALIPSQPSTLTDEERARVALIAKRCDNRARWAPDRESREFNREDAEFLRTLAGKEQR